MQRTLELMDILFKIIKWPYFIGYTLLYNYGFNDYIILDILWFVCGFLIAKDIYAQYKKEKSQKEESTE